MATDELDIERLQRWMLSVIAHPDGVSDGELDELIAASPHPSALDGLGVYSQIYWSKMVATLAADFGVLERAMGSRAFHRCAVSYLVAHPPRHRLLSRLGAGLPGFLADEVAELAHRRFFTELARLERAVEEVHGEQRCDLLDGAALHSIPQDQWAEAQFRTVPAMRIFELAYPVNEYFEATIAGRKPVIPEPEPTWLVVWRHAFAVWRAEMNQSQYTILRALQSGETLGGALERCLELPGVGPQDLLESLSGWFERWTTDGLFAAVTTSS